MKRRRSLALVVPFLLAVAAIVWLVVREEPRSVSTAAVRVGALAVTVEEEGATRVRERYEVTAPVDGWAPRLLLEVGDPVRAGEPLLAIEPAPAAALDPRARAEASARVEGARAALEVAEGRAAAAAAVADLARDEHARVAALAARDGATPHEVERAAAEARRAEAERESALSAVEVARYDLEAARARLELVGRGDDAGRVEVTAPADGVVLAVHRESQGVVRAGERLLDVGDPTSLEVVVEVLSADAVRIGEGARVRLHRWGGDEPLEARVRRVEPAGFTEVSALGVEEQRVRVVVDVTSPFERWRALGDAYRVEAEFVLWEEPAVLQVPETATFAHDGGRAVFVVDGERARLVPVRLGRSGGLVVQVLEGLSEGQRVVLQPGDAVTDGARVRELGRGGDR